MVAGGYGFQHQLLLRFKWKRPAARPGRPVVDVGEAAWQLAAAHHHLRRSSARGSSSGRKAAWKKAGATGASALSPFLSSKLLLSSWQTRETRDDGLLLRHRG